MFKFFQKPVSRQSLASTVLEMRLKMGLAPAWSACTVVVPTDRAYLTTTEDEVRKIADAAWLPWQETKVGGGICEVQGYAVLVEAYKYVRKKGLPGRLAIYAALTAGDRPHVYIVAEISASKLVILDQTAGVFLDPDEMDSPIRIVYA